MVSAVVLGGGIFTSCSDDDDDEESDVTYTYEATAGGYTTTFTFTGKESTVKQKGKWTMVMNNPNAQHSWTPTDYTVAKTTSDFTYNGETVSVYEATLNYTGGTTGTSMSGYFSTDWKTLYTGHGNYVSAYTLKE